MMRLSNDALLRIAGETARFGGWQVDLADNICAGSDKIADIHDVPRGCSPPLQAGSAFGIICETHTRMIRWKQVKKKQRIPKM
jgi:hypothetical protein